jgi:hypothetical protein
VLLSDTLEVSPNIAVRAYFFWVSIRASRFRWSASPVRGPRVTSLVASIRTALGSPFARRKSKARRARVEVVNVGGRHSNPSLQRTRSCHARCFGGNIGLGNIQAQHLSRQSAPLSEHVRSEPRTGLREIILFLGRRFALVTADGGGTASRRVAAFQHSSAGARSRRVRRLAKEGYADARRNPVGSR